MYTDYDDETGIDIRILNVDYTEYRYSDVSTDWDLGIYIFGEIRVGTSRHPISLHLAHLRGN